MNLKRQVSVRLDNKVFADKDVINKNEARSHIIAGLMSLEFQLSFFLA